MTDKTIKWTPDMGFEPAILKTEGRTICSWDCQYEALKKRLDKMEAALREIIDMHPFKDPEGDASVKAVVDLMFSINLVARAALGEKKDG